jgi:NAD(P)-dependent dehydrogenase (short-subunit alcohol dehydrogenase family)
LNNLIPTCHYYGQPCNVADEKAVISAWFKIAQGNSGRIDVLVQAAGVGKTKISILATLLRLMRLRGPIVLPHNCNARFCCTQIVGNTGIKTEDVDADNFDAVFRVNVHGIFNGCKAVLPFMKAKGYGRIVNIASIAGKEGNAGMLAYSASKAAVIGLTKTIGKEYAESGVTCNALAPAVVRTEMVEAMPPEQVKYMTDKIPMKRCGTIDEIASMVCFMASSESSFTTGFCFDATGGRSVY